MAFYAWFRYTYILPIKGVCETHLHQAYKPMQMYIHLTIVVVSLSLY